MTGKVRGLLCRRCNSANGMYGDDPKLLQKAGISAGSAHTGRCCPAGAAAGDGTLQRAAGLDCRTESGAVNLAEALAGEATGLYQVKNTESELRFAVG